MADFADERGSGYADDQLAYLGDGTGNATRFGEEVGLSAEEMVEQSEPGLARLGEAVENEKMSVARL